MATLADNNAGMIAEKVAWGQRNLEQRRQQR
jgi:hypothetical protein